MIIIHHCLANRSQPGVEKFVFCLIISSVFHSVLMVISMEGAIVLEVFRLESIDLAISMLHLIHQKVGIVFQLNQSLNQSMAIFVA